MHLLKIVVLCAASMIAHGAPEKVRYQLISSDDNISSVSIDAAQSQKGLRFVNDLAKNFRSRLFDILAIDIVETIAYSSTILFLPLLTIALASQGATRTKFEKVLGFSSNETLLVERGLRATIDVLKNEQLGLEMSNEIHFPPGYPTNTEFARAINKFYVPPGKSVNSPRSTKNKDVNLRTYISDIASKFRQLISQNGEYVILKNAIHFGGRWKTAFDPSRTTLRPFWKYGSEPIAVPTMYTRGEFRHGKIKKLDSSFIEIPFEFGTAMYVVRSDSQKGSELLFKELGEIDVEDLVRDSKRDVLDVYLPKFKITTSELSGEWLSRIFNPKNPPGQEAKLDEIAPGLFFEDIRGEVVFEVDERGGAGSTSSGAASKTRKTRSRRNVRAGTFEANRPSVVIVATTTDAGRDIDLLRMFISGSELLPMQRNFQLAD